MPRLAPAASPRPRQARALETRRRLLAAAVDCLVEHGYARCTTSDVCQRAGVSQGALFKHFPSRSALWVETVAHLFGELIADFQRAFAQAADHDDRIGAALQLLDRAFREPRLRAAFELYVAARTDPGLRDALAPVLEAHRRALRDEARRLFPLSARDPEFDAFVEVMISAMQGRALGALAGPDPRADMRELAVLYRLARRELAADAASPGSADARSAAAGG